jgi:hypothetical protein
MQPEEVRLPWSTLLDPPRADAWLKNNFEKLLESPMFQSGGSGLLVITPFDQR